MFKPVKFLGFESRPDLKAYFERLLPELRREVGRWANRVEATFELKDPDPDRLTVELTLSLTLPHIEGKGSDRMQFKDVAQPNDFRKWVRFAWEELLDELLERRAEQTEKEWAETQGG